MAKMEGLEFEKPINELDEQIRKLKALDSQGDGSLKPHIRQLERRLHQITYKIFDRLTSWEILQISRHPQRPTTMDYVDRITTEWTEIHGDRRFRDDNAVITGFARLDGLPVLIVGQQKGRDIQEKVRRNFGMMHPEGYRKAMRAMHIAERQVMPVIVFVDTMGAYPGVGAEERGQAEAIARNVREMSMLRTPIIVVVIGEGGSGGALGIGVGDRTLIQQFAVYSVISPEGCAAILWRDNAKANLAAEALQITAPRLIHHGMVDEIIKEPIGGAHRNSDRASGILKRVLRRHLAELIRYSIDDLMDMRFQKYRKYGAFEELKPSAQKE